MSNKIIQIAIVDKFDGGGIDNYLFFRDHIEQMKNKLKEILTKKYNFEAESTEYFIKDADDSDDSDDYTIMTRAEMKQHYLDEFKKYEDFYKNLINKIDNIKTEKEILDLSRQNIDIIGHKMFLINHIEIN